MIETLRLPIITLEMGPALPHSKLEISTDDEQVIQAINEAELNYNNKFFIQFKNANTENTYTVGILSTLLSKSITAETSEVNLEIMLETRAIPVGELQSNNNCTTIEIQFDSEPAALSTEDEFVFLDVRNMLIAQGILFLNDQALILNMLQEMALPDVIVDVAVSNLKNVEVNFGEFLEELNFSKRLDILKNYLITILSQLNLENTIENIVREEINKEQKEYYLRKKIRVIQEELGDVDKASTDAEELREKIKAAGMPENVEKQVLKELRRYQNTSSASPESNMVRSYLDLMIELPWKEETTDTLDITAAKAKLDETHFGLEKVKDRIIEYLGVKLYTNKNPQTILCLAGPPGVGKTTLAKSIAEALGRKFVKQSMGGVKDEAEVRGHRRTYMGALPGRIINGIKESGVINPVFLLDEIDKIGSDYKGDPSAALLEVLDPAQNVHFMDHYTEVEYDLSKVMFICTANYLENVPAPLKDRMEIIELSSYTELEKFHIAKNYVVYRSLKKNGLEKEKFDITDDAIRFLIKHYTREAGARQLERCMDSLVRKSIKKILSEKVDVVHIDESTITEMLGKKLFEHNGVDKENLVGTVNGLAYTQAGGDTLQIEVQLVHGKGNIKLTGKLGDVMKESAEVAYTWVRANALKYNISLNKFDDYDVHIHVPEGATPKDGPSAGVTMTTAILSAFTNRLVHYDLGMTGEVTLRGRVLPIGGLKEKSIAAYRAGLKRILIPQENVKDLEDIPQEVKDNLEITPVSKVEEVIKYALI